ncbi:hypothetical protein ACU4GG_13960 [Streptomyces nojiriensis]
MNTTVNTVNGHAKTTDPQPPTTPQKANRSTPADPGAGEGKKPSAASRLVALAREGYTFVTSTDGRPYAVAIDGPNIALPSAAGPDCASVLPASTPTPTTATWPHSPRWRTP